MKRTKRSLINIVTSIIPSFIIIIIAFVKFKYFIKVYGDDLNGVVQLITQIYAYLTLAELGFGAATNIKLYKYFQENNEKKITEVFNESKSLYFKSGMFIFISGILISFVLPFFIKNNTVDWYYITLIMALYAVDFLADYLYGLPYRNLLIVNEKVYVINIIKTTQQIIFKIIELILIINHVNLILIILLSVIANLTGSFLLVNITKKFYPYLKLYKGKDKTVTKPVKDIAINNLSDIVNEKTDSIIIANQMGLKDTSIYSMYNLIINYIYMFILNFVTGVKASIGAIISNNNISREESYSIFKQFLLALNYISILCLIIFTLSASSFMGIFINTTYKESFMVVLLFGIVLWINVLSKTFHVIVEVKGYYKQIKNFALGQAIMNIILSLIFVQKLGILGVLLATVLTNAIIIMPMKAKIAFNEFDKSSKYFYKLILCSILSVTIILFICNKMNIYNYSSNLINWFLITGILFVLIAIVLFGYYYIIFEDFRNLVKRFLNSKLVFRIKRSILAIISYINYNIFIKNKKIKVLSIEDTINEILTKKCSIVRYGDGEIDLINGKALKFQDYDEKLAQRLEEIIKLKSSEKLLIAVPEIFNGLNIYTKDEKEFWAISLLKTKNNWFKYCQGTYYNAFLSRPYLRYKNNNCDEIFKNIKKIFKNREIILVEGEFSRLGVGNDLFDNAKKVERILCPTKNAYKLYDEILKEICKQNKKKLIIVSLGPTAKPLVYDLSNLGYQAIDLGHIDLEYEWYLQKATKKIKIKNKYVNEVDDNGPLEEVKDKKYKNQILINLNDKGENND